MSPISFRTEDGVSLKGEIRHPEGTPRGTAVLCHPHPRHGGSKDHPLLWALRNDLAGRRRVVVLTFNFRGVMGSEGEHSAGDREHLDVEAAVERVREEAPGPTVLLGWSFGAGVALRHALSDGRIAALVLIGLALADTGEKLPSVPDRSELATLEAPVLLVVGAADQFSPVPDVKALARRMRSAETLVVPDTDHFFWRRERAVAAAVGGFVDRVLRAQ